MAVPSSRASEPISKAAMCSGPFGTSHVTEPHAGRGFQRTSPSFLSFFLSFFLLFFLTPRPSIIFKIHRRLLSYILTRTIVESHAHFKRASLIRRKNNIVFTRTNIQTYRNRTLFKDQKTTSPNGTDVRLESVRVTPEER